MKTIKIHENTHKKIKQLQSINEWKTIDETINMLAIIFINWTGQKLEDKKYEPK